MDERAKQKGICGVTTVGGTGIEWVCIRQVHGAVYTRNRGDRNHRKGDVIYSTTPNSERHYYVPKWPNRKKDSE